MAFPRLAGVILHPTSLPGGHGVGDLGRSARDFADFLHKAGIGIWQVLPLGPTGAANSPYQTTSSYAGNPLLLSLDNLVELELLEPEDLHNAPRNGKYADFDHARDFKEHAFRKALDRFQDARGSAELAREFELFCKLYDKEWLDNFALFMAIKDFYKGTPWYEWKDLEARRHTPEGVEKYHKILSHEVRYHKFLQFLFFRQWMELKRYLADKNIKLMGDVPIYCAHDSADIWGEPEFFMLDDDGRAEFQAGVPPDYFSATGQLWGNPLYNWKAMADDGYRWWVRRVKATLAMVDMLRIDHFRGFQAYWAVDKGEETAIKGRWVEGPGQALFDVFKRELGDNLPILAEDLGVITPAVDRLRVDNGLPGMKVLHFAFSDGAEAYLPHTYESNTVCYVATHDNDTTLGWYQAEGPDYEHMDRGGLEAERDKARRYLGRDGSGMPWDLMRLAFASVADTAMVLMQDILFLDNSCRMNRPGLGENQWRWRLLPDQLRDAPWGGVRELVYLFGREPDKPVKEKVSDVRTQKV
ncbi:MAG: 4-alpha-glucanotransferase [Planctomycetaceae bacterium]|nr:4-alpha-glucanotransferase [Planctomycetaceae bacterium]